jgi:dipeptidase E
MPSAAMNCIRGVFAGAGSAMFGEPAVVDAVLALAGKPAAAVNFVYLGTATYDLPKFREKQVREFEARGVTVTNLDVTCRTPNEATVAGVIDGADVILVSGGNTLFAIDRWTRAKMVEPLRRAMMRGATLCGGSAGAICWFDGGHSDSMDPDWYRTPMLAGEGAADESYGVGPPKSEAERKAWTYMRVPGLGFLPGLLCPHHDRTQSNGVLRATDFDGMLLRHRGETGVCIDHHAALVVDKGGYKVLALDGKPGSLGPGESMAPGEGVPAVWIKRVVAGDAAATPAIEARPLPPSGLLEDVLREAAEIVEDPKVQTARAENPSDDLQLQ